MINIGDLIKNGSAKIKGPRLQRALHSLMWRQKFQKSEYYEYALNSSELSDPKSNDENAATFRLNQIENGEMKGLGTGTFVWPASHVLAKYLEKVFPRGSLTGKSLCDIGSGAGLPAYVAAYLGARVTLSDQATLLEFMEDNKRTCLDSCPDVFDADNILIREYNWGGSLEGLDAPFDLILVSDCILPKLYPIEDLVRAMRAVMGPTSVAFVSYEHRVYPYFDPRNEFRRLCKLHGMRVVEVPLSQHDDIYRCDDIEIWKVYLDSTSTDGNSIHSESRGVASDEFQRRIVGSVVDVEVPLQMKARLSYEPFEETQREICFNALSSDSKNIDIHITQTVDGSIGCRIWASSILTSRFLLHTSWNQMYKFNFGVDLAGQMSSGKRPLAIDIGSGCGLTAIALLICGFDVVCTDKSQVFDLMYENIRRFKSENESALPNMGNIEVVEFDWVTSSPADLVTAFQNKFGKSNADLILCSDCCYDINLMQPLVQAVRTLMSETSVLLVANELRSALENFLSLCRTGSSDFIMDFKDISLLDEDFNFGGHLGTRSVRLLVGHKKTAI